MKLIIDISDITYDSIMAREKNAGWLFSEELKAIHDGTPLDNLLQRLRKRISDLYNTDVTYDNGDYNTMDTPTLDKVLEYFDSEVQE